MGILSYNREELIHIVGIEYLGSIGVKRKNLKLELNELMIKTSKFKNLDVNKCINPKIVNSKLFAPIFQFEYKK